MKGKSPLFHAVADIVKADAALRREAVAVLAPASATEPDILASGHVSATRLPDGTHYWLMTLREPGGRRVQVSGRSGQPLADVGTLAAQALQLDPECTVTSTPSAA